MCVLPVHIAINVFGIFGFVFALFQIEVQDDCVTVAVDNWALDGHGGALVTDLVQVQPMWQTVPAWGSNSVPGAMPAPDPYWHMMLSGKGDALNFVIRLDNKHLLTDVEFGRRPGELAAARAQDRGEWPSASDSDHGEEQAARRVVLECPAVRPWWECPTPEPPGAWACYPEPKFREENMCLPPGANARQPYEYEVGWNPTSDRIRIRLRNDASERCRQRWERGDYRESPTWCVRTCVRVSRGPFYFVTAAPCRQRPKVARPAGRSWNRASHVKGGQQGTQVMTND